ncbi:unnamed protein product, partial [Allacma fusca]
LDNTKYLVSELFPIESIIKISTKQEQPMRVGVTYSFDCQISTFILLPNIQFVLSFQNGVEQLVNVMSQTTEATIGNAADTFNSTNQLHPKFNFSGWDKPEGNPGKETGELICIHNNKNKNNRT